MISCSCSHAEGNNLIERGYYCKGGRGQCKDLVLKKGRGLVPKSKRIVSFDRREVPVGQRGVGGGLDSRSSIQWLPISQ